MREPWDACQDSRYDGMRPDAADHCRHIELAQRRHLGEGRDYAEYSEFHVIRRSLGTSGHSKFVQLREKGKWDGLSVASKVVCKEKGGERS